MDISQQKNRIVFIDILRAFAVIMMVQGHTIDLVLAGVYKDYNLNTFYAWNWLRGMTAPIFLFTSGTVFTYLLNYKNISYIENPRVKKGIIRFAQLVAVGYFLRFPTYNPNMFRYIKPEFWNDFFAIDVLHLIGFGILFIIFFGIVSEKLRINTIWVYIISIVIIFIANLFIPGVDWKGIFPIFIAGYFYQGTGSLFPLVPWLAYVFAGAIFGAYLASHQTAYKSPKEIVKFFAVGIAIIIFSQVADKGEILLTGKSTYWTTSPNLVLFRIGFVLSLNAAFAFALKSVNSVPGFVIKIGQNTLLIYALHLIVLYRTSFTEYFRPRYDFWSSSLIALGMIILMIFLVYIINFVNVKFLSFVKSKVKFRKEV